MARVVLIHGIAQEQGGPAGLETEWLPALADGVRAGGHPTLADSLWPDSSPRSVDVRMAFYGNLFIDPEAQGGAPGLDDLDEEQLQVAAAIGHEWLEHGSERADHPDHSTAAMELSMLQDNGQIMGRREELTRTVMQAVANVPWFAKGAMGVAGKFVNKTLTQVTLYLTDPSLRQKIQQRVLALVDDDTEVIVGHSLGSVVAYEIAAGHLGRPLPLLVTLGSPLGLRSIVYDRVQPHPPVFPEHVQRWVNIADRNDLVAAEPDLSELFAGTTNGQVFDAGWVVDNGNQPHTAAHYLSKRQVGQPVAEALE